MPPSQGDKSSRSTMVPRVAACMTALRVQTAKKKSGNLGGRGGMDRSLSIASVRIGTATPPRAASYLRAVTSGGRPHCRSGQPSSGGSGPQDDHLGPCSEASSWWSPVGVFALALRWQAGATSISSCRRASRQHAAGQRHALPWAAHSASAPTAKRAIGVRGNRPAQIHETANHRRAGSKGLISTISLLIRWRTPRGYGICHRPA